MVCGVSAGAIDIESHTVGLNNLAVGQFGVGGFVVAHHRGIESGTAKRPLDSALRPDIERLPPTVYWLLASTVRCEAHSSRTRKYRMNERRTMDYGAVEVKDQQGFPSNSRLAAP